MTETTRPVRVRIAPSPTGDPHVGTAYQALFDLAVARQNAGQFILRIEDTDRQRFIPESEQRIFDHLRWLHLDWDEGPDVGGPYGPYRQSERLSIYRDHVETLVANGHAYHCWCTPERLTRVREEQTARKEPPRYDRFCLGKSEAERRREPECAEVSVIRMQMPAGGSTGWDDLVRGPISFENSVVDDQVLLKSDGFPTYHLAVVVDDHLMRISHAVRGEEWISSTPKHLVLYQMFGWEPPRFAHLSVLRNVDRGKISKRKHPWATLPWFRAQGFLPEAMVNFLALMGFSLPDEQGGTREIFGFDDIARGFAWDRIGSTAPIFDLEKLTWLNGHYIRHLPLDDLWSRVEPFLGGAGLQIADRDYARRVIALEQERIHTLVEAPALTGFFFADELTYDIATMIPKGLNASGTDAALAAARVAFTSAPPEATVGELEAQFRALAEAQGLKTGQLFGAIRVAITGTTKAPPLFDTAMTLGRDRVLARLDAARRALAASLATT
jgi:glutamyl-tRNA synthetase